MGVCVSFCLSLLEQTQGDLYNRRPGFAKKAVVGLLDFDIGLDSDANKLGAVGSHVVLRTTGALRRIQDFLTK
ncbi:MAG TPA: hypothetical protein DCE24_06575 [Porphyromonadaceae bacterium]|nr:hypothetical protein [Porphyromonadaceae bacterium]